MAVRGRKWVFEDKKEHLKIEWIENRVNHYTSVEQRIVIKHH